MLQLQRTHPKETSLDGLQPAVGGRRHADLLPLRWITLVCLCAAALSGCGGASESGSVDRTEITLSRIRAEPAGDNCTTGGVRIEAGPDADHNGILGDSEVEDSQYVCHGAAGALVATTVEPAGSNCPAGGIKATAGQDADGDGILDAEEVDTTQYVCNGTDGTDGAQSLVKVSAESAGAHCTTGGTKIEAGIDADRDDVLDASEVTSTAYVCRPAGVTWVEVTADAVQAEANTGYRASGSADITITLPNSTDLAEGDLVSVAGAGTGTWTIAQNDGQTIYGGSLGHIGVSWTPKESNRGWQAIASSNDGTKLAAVEYGGQIYTSVDSGETWTPRDSPRLWYTIASSADGSKLVAGVPGGQLYTSSDSGLNWTARETARSWYHVASSADGTILLAAPGGEQLYTSHDAGVTWVARDSNRLWFSAAASADGQRLVAAEYGGQVYTSSDSGVSWTPRESNRAWASLASSADGLKLVAAVFGGQIYTSADGGLTWFAQAWIGNWIGLDSSANGQYLVAVQAGGQIYTSSDGGSTWIPRFTDHNWSSVCSSADGRQLLAVEHGGQIYKSTPFSTLGVDGGVQGGPYDALELQYQGNGVFMPLSHEGSLTVF